MFSVGIRWPRIVQGGRNDLCQIISSEGVARGPTVVTGSFCLWLWENF